MPRSPSDHRLCPPHGYHGNREEEFQARRRAIRDGRGRWHSQVRPGTSSFRLAAPSPGTRLSPPDQDHPLDQARDERERRRRQDEEEFQARYRSDPNLARCPVKPQPSEEAMRMLAHVGRVRHQRRHSDVSLAPDHLTPRRTGRERSAQPQPPPPGLSVTPPSPPQASARATRGGPDPGRCLWSEQAAAAARLRRATAPSTWSPTPPSGGSRPIRAQHRGRGRPPPCT